MAFRFLDEPQTAQSPGQAQGRFRFLDNDEPQGDPMDFSRFAEPQQAEPIRATPRLPVEDGTQTTPSSAFEPLDAQEGPRPPLSERFKLGARVGFSDSGMGLLARTPAGQTLKSLPAGLGVGTDITGGLFRLFDVPTNAEETVALRQQFENMPDSKSLTEFAATGAGILGGGMASPENFVPIGRGATLLRSAARTGGVTGGLNALVNIGRQELDIAQGVKDEFSIGEFAAEAGIGAVAGGLIHLSLEGLGRLSQRIREAFSSGKLTPEQAAELTRLDQAAQLEATRRAQAIDADRTPTRFDIDEKATAALREGTGPLPADEAAERIVGERARIRQGDLLTAEEVAEQGLPFQRDAVVRGPADDAAIAAGRQAEDAAIRADVENVIQERVALLSQLTGEPFENIVARRAGKTEAAWIKELNDGIEAARLGAANKEAQLAAVAPEQEDIPLPGDVRYLETQNRTAVQATQAFNDKLLRAVESFRKDGIPINAETRNAARALAGATTTEEYNLLRKGVYERFAPKKAKAATTPSRTLKSFQELQTPETPLRQPAPETAPDPFAPRSESERLARARPAEPSQAGKKSYGATASERVDRPPSTPEEDLAAYAELDRTFDSLPAKEKGPYYDSTSMLRESLKNRHFNGDTPTPELLLERYPAQPKPTTPDAIPETATPEGKASQAQAVPEEVVPRATPEPPARLTYEQWLAESKKPGFDVDGPRPYTKSMTELKAVDKRVAELRKKGSSAGYIAPQVAGPVGGFGVGSAYGLTQGETPEERLKNAFMFGTAGAAAGAGITSGPRLMEAATSAGSRRPALRQIGELSTRMAAEGAPANVPTPAKPAPTFYSRLTRTIEQSPQGKANGAQWKATIKNSKLGVNKDEYSLVGVDDLDDAKTYTKQEVLDYLKANEVVVKDVTLSQKPEDTRQLPPIYSLERMPDGEFTLVNRETGVGRRLYTTNEAEANTQALANTQGAGPRDQTSFSSYVLPGAKEGTYREVLLTVPELQVGKRPTERPHWEVVEDINKAIGMEYRRGVDEIRRTVAGAPIDSIDTASRDAAENALRKAGREDLLNEYKRALPDTDNRIDRSWNDGHSQYSDVDNPIVRLRYNERVTADGKRMLFLEEVQAPQKGEFAKMPPLFQKNWREIAFKWALRKADDEGFDSVGWTTGAQQAERYDLSKQLSEVSYSGTNLKAFDLNGDEVISRTGVLPEELPDIIGKEAAQKLMAQEPQGTLRTISGLDLKVGGEGLSRLYDTDFRNVVNGLPVVKKAGQKVGTAEIGDPMLRRWVFEEPDGTFVVKDRKDGADPRAKTLFRFIDRDKALEVAQETQLLPVHSLDLTPAIKNAVRGGQNLGFVTPQILASPLAQGAVGGTIGAGIGITQGETPEERIQNALAGFGIGAGLATGSGVAARRLSQPNRVARRLGVIEEFPTISNDVSNARLRLDRFTASLLRGSPLRKHFFDAAKRTEAAINASTDEAKIVLADMRSRINANTRSVKQRTDLEAKLNEVFTDISKIEELPAYLRAPAHRIYEIRLRGATRLAALEGLTDATRETITERGGNYLARSYAIFNLKDGLEARAYKAAIPKADREAAMDAIQELWAPPPRSAEEVNLAKNTIELAAQNKESAVAVIKSLRPWMTDDDAARVAAWVAAGKQTGSDSAKRTRAIYNELVKPSEVTRNEAAVLLDEFLDRDNFLGFSVGRKQIGGKDVTSLYRKQEIDPRLRKVLGEIKDPMENAYRSIKNQVNLIERDAQQREFIRIGEQMGIMTRDPDIAAQKGMRPFLESGTELNSPYDNWDGVFVYPWLREEFAGTVGKASELPRAMDLAAKTIKTATGAFKWLKLIPAPDSRSVNLIGAWWNNITNGRALNPIGKGTRDGIRAVFLANGIISPKGDLNTQKLLKLREVLVRNRVLDESVLGQDFIQNAKKGLTGDFFEKLDRAAQKEINSPALRKTYMAGRFIASGNEFAAGDDIMRVAGFLDEAQRYKQAFPNLPEDELWNVAGRVMNQTGMTYSEVPSVLRELSQLGIADPFIAFPYSLFRSTANTARLGTAELLDGLATGNTALAKIGSTRLAALGIGAAAASGYGIAKFVNDSHGVTPEQEEAGKQYFVPEYAKDSPLAFDAKIENGKGTFVQMNYLLPTSLVTSAIEDGIKVGMEDGAASGIAAGAERVASNFTGLIGEERPRVAPVPRTIGIALGLINEDSFGRPIYNPQDPDKWEKIGKQMGYEWAPGFWSKAVRLAKANDPQAETGGRVYSNKEEWLRFLGRRATTVDARQMLPSQAYRLNQEYQQAVRLYQEAVAKGGEADPAYAKSQQVAKEKFDEMVGLRDAARAWDIDDKSIMAGFIRAGLSKKMVAQVMREVYIPKPQQQIDQQIQRKQMERERYRSMGNESEVPQSTPERAAYFLSQLDALPDPQSRNAYLQDQQRKGLLTPEVLAQMRQLKNQN